MNSISCNNMIHESLICINVSNYPEISFNITSSKIKVLCAVLTMYLAHSKSEPTCPLPKRFSCWKTPRCFLNWVVVLRCVDVIILIIYIHIYTSNLFKQKSLCSLVDWKTNTTSGQQNRAMNYSKFPNIYCRRFSVLSNNRMLIFQVQRAHGHFHHHSCKHLVPVQASGR